MVLSIKKEPFFYGIIFQYKSNLKNEKGFYIIKFRKIFKIDFLTFQKGYFFITRNVGKKKSMLFCTKTYR